MGKYTKQLSSFALALILVIVMVAVLIPGAVSKTARVTAPASQGTWPSTIDDLAGRVSFVLVGTKLREEPVQTFYPNASYYLDVYHIDRMLKASFPWAGEEFTILYNRNSNTASDRQQPVTPVNGEACLLFAMVSENTGTLPPKSSAYVILPLQPDGGMKTSYDPFFTECMPFVMQPAFHADPVSAILKSSGLSQAPLMPFHDPLRSDAALPDLIRASDMILRTKLKYLRQRTGAYGLCQVLAIGDPIKLSTTFPVPKTITLDFFTEGFVLDEKDEYLLFLFEDGYYLYPAAERKGAVISRSDSAAWDAAMAALKGNP
ncbi:MAG TPA: hypothetical protein VIL27_08425 [Clostridia bacterium]